MLYFSYAKNSIIGTVTKERRVETETISDANSASRLNLVANNGVAVAQGQADVMSNADATVSSKFIIFERTIAIEGSIKSLSRHTKYIDVFVRVFLKSTFARYVPNIIIAIGVFKFAICFIGSRSTVGSLMFNTNSSNPKHVPITPGFKNAFLKDIDLTLPEHTQTPCIHIDILNTARYADPKKTPSLPREAPKRGIAINPQLEYTELKIFMR